MHIRKADAVGGNEGIRRGKIGGGDGGLAGELVEIVGQEYEVITVDFAAKIPITQ